METTDITKTNTGITEIIHDNPILIPATIGIAGLIWLAKVAIDKGRKIKLHLSKDVSLDVD